MLKNIVANYLGRFWSAISNFIFIPLYIHFLGLEGYSIVSLSIILSSVMSVFDLGLSATLSRELAVKNASTLYKYKLFRTLEGVYIGIAVIIVLLIFFASGYLAASWLNIDSYHYDDVKHFISVMGLIAASQFLFNFYTGGLTGLEKQVASNIFQIIFGALKNGLVVAVLYLGGGVLFFFYWQFAVSIIMVIAVRYMLNKSINTHSDETAYTSYYDFTVFKDVWKFALGMLLISAVAIINSQLDKIVISKLLPISQLGLYTLAVSLAQVLVVLINPISAAILPRLTSYYSLNQYSESRTVFRKYFSLACIICGSIAGIMLVWSRDIILIWTNSAKIANEGSQFVVSLLLGMLMLALAVMPFAVAIANGYTKLNNYIGIVSIFLTIPGYYILIREYGPIGAGITFSIVQFVVTIVYIKIINTKYLQIPRAFTYYSSRIGLPVITSLFIAKLVQVLILLPTNRFLQIGMIGSTVLLTGIVNYAVFYYLENKWQ